ncbi:MAG: YraN family protein [Chloroflexi bacterium]|nr:YraN family protein [Chloroflexota bacterium]
MPTARTRLGTRGEDIATAYLQQQGHSLLERNFRTRYGEVDIVTRHDDTIVFVEVRTGRTGTYGTPEESVTARKGQRLVLAAQQYLQDNGLEQAHWRIDLVSVRMEGGAPKVTHLMDVVSATA